MATTDPLDYLVTLEKFGITFGLDNIRGLCRALGNPQDAYRSVIVGGTNGKGSVTAMAETALRTAGHRTARYTSPHLVRLEERFVIDGQPVSTEALRDVAEDIRRTTETLRQRGALPAHPTFFEATTAMAFELFRRAHVDVAVIEVGLGGRFDATNVVSPQVTAITSIDLDHERYLGRSLGEIAFEKAGIIKPGATVVVGERKPEALDVIVQVCRERGAPLVRSDDGVVWGGVEAPLADGRATFEATTPERRYGPRQLALRGRHQVANALVAVRLLEALESSGVQVGARAIAAGLTQVSWRGRLDLVAHGGRAALLDAAHNPAGAQVLAAYLREVYPDRLPLVFGVMEDKDIEGMLRALLPCAAGLVVTRPAMARAATPARLARLARAIAPTLDVVEADELDVALERAWARGHAICVAGSIFLVGAALSHLEGHSVARNSLS